MTITSQFPAESMEGKATSMSDPTLPPNSKTTTLNDPPATAETELLPLDESQPTTSATTVHLPKTAAQDTELVGMQPSPPVTTTEAPAMPDPPTETLNDPPATAETELLPLDESQPTTSDPTVLLPKTAAQDTETELLPPPPLDESHPTTGATTVPLPKTASQDTELVGMQPSPPVTTAEAPAMPDPPTETLNDPPATATDVEIDESQPTTSDPTVLLPKTAAQDTETDESETDESHPTTGATTVHLPKTAVQDTELVGTAMETELLPLDESQPTTTVLLPKTAMQPSETVPCESCSKGYPAEMFCTGCWKLLCKRCIECHSSITIFQSHSLKSLDFYYSLSSPKCDLCQVGIANTFCNTCSCCLCVTCERLQHHESELSTHHLVRLKKSPPEKTCGGCTAGEKAAMHCKTCNTDICNDCVQHHKILTVFSGHTIEELDKDEVEESCKACTSGDAATAYCKSCGGGICENCTRSHQQLIAFSNHRVTAAKQKTQETNCEMCQSGTCKSNACTTCIQQHRMFRVHDTIDYDVEKEKVCQY